MADSRSPIDIETEQVTEQLKTLEVQMQTCKDGISELALFVTRSRQLELELAPKEAEHKNILAAFQRLCESAASLKKVFQADDLGNLTASASTRLGTAGSSPADAGGQQRRSTIMTPPNDLPGGNSPPGTAAGQDAASRDAMKALTALTKNSIIAILNSVFDTPQTPMERRAQAEQLEAGAAVPADGQVAPATAPANARKPTIMSEKIDRPFDPDLACPVGIDPNVFSEVLRLRLNRMTVETAMTTVQEQLTQARAIVERRRDEGASKLLLKKLEKQQEEAKRRLAELARMKVEEEILAKSNQALNSSAPQREKSAGKSRGAAK